MAKETVPLSIPNHLLELNRQLWTVSALDIRWHELEKSKQYIVSGSAFIDKDDPYGKKGNPFTVITGRAVGQFDKAKKDAIAQQTGTPETIFINRCEVMGESQTETQYTLNLTVKTPMGKELGACAHGFTGAIQTLMEMGVISLPATVSITTTLDTSAHVMISKNKVISLEFMVQEPRYLALHQEKLSKIFGTDLHLGKAELPVLSVGSSKLTVEVTQDIFSAVQQNLRHLNYDALLALQNEFKINGVHLFCRNGETGLPEKVIQVNAFLGKENVVDPATGVSCAAQVGSDLIVQPSQLVKLMQYTSAGPSADLLVTKGEAGKVAVGGTAVLFNFQTI